MTAPESNAAATVVIPNALGMHAKPTMLFTQMAARYACEVVVHRTDDERMSADGKSMLGMLTLALTQGTEVRILATGDDAAEAVDALARLIQGGFEA